MFCNNVFDTKEDLRFFSIWWWVTIVWKYQRVIWSCKSKNKQNNSQKKKKRGKDKKWCASYAESMLVQLSHCQHVAVMSCFTLLYRPLFHSGIVALDLLMQIIWNLLLSNVSNHRCKGYVQNCTPKLTLLVLLLWLYFPLAKFSHNV